MTSRFKALIYVAIGWIGAQIASWALNSWLDNFATKTNLQTFLQLVADALSYVGSDFGGGFLVGALLFSIWDWPVFGRWIKKQRERYRNKDADEVLAKQCDEVSQLIYEQAATLERLRNENFWASASASAREDHERAWREARSTEAREEERIRKQIGPKIQAILVALKVRRIKMDLWGLSLSAHDLPTASFFFADLANSLRAGDYLERSFSASRVDIPARM